MFNCTPVFWENYNSKAKVTVNQGGTSSSKTYSLIQLLYLKAIQESESVITVAGQDIPNLKKGAYRDAETIYNNTPELSQYIQSWNRTDRIIYFKNGSLIEFNSYSNQQDAKSGKRDYLFINEANGIDYLIYWQLAIRTRKQIYIDYNPTVAFWCHEQLIGNEGVKLIISDHRHNTFLSQEEHSKIEGIKDKDLWLVYARGKTGNLTGIIYPNWIRIPDDQFPRDQPFFGGLDFGYTNDPTAGVKIVVIGESVFLHEICYTPGIAPVQMKEIFTANGFNNHSEIYCEHDPEQISQLRRLGLTVLMARKGNGSIKAGILKMKEYKVFYTASSENLHTERTKYMWVIDPTTGKSTNLPSKSFDHLMDAARYGIYTKFFRK